MNSELSGIKIFCPRCQETVSVFFSPETKLLLVMRLYQALCPRCRLPVTGEVLENLNDSVVVMFLESWSGRILLLLVGAVLLLIAMLTF